MLDSSLAEPSLLHPGLTLLAGVVEASRRFDEHVKAHEKPEDVLATIVVDDGVVNDERAALGNSLKRPPNEGLLLIETPIVKDVTHGDDVRLWNWMVEKVPRLEPDARTETVRDDIFFENRSDFGEIEADTGKVRIGLSDLDNKVALRSADIDNATCACSSNLSAAPGFAMSAAGAPVSRAGLSRGFRAKRM